MHPHTHTTPTPTHPSPPSCPRAALKIACSGSAPRHQVDHIIYKLQKRLKEQGWLVTLKALMVFHRLMREIDPSFQEQLTKFCARTGEAPLVLLLCTVMRC